MQKLYPSFDNARKQAEDMASQWHPDSEMHKLLRAQLDIEDDIRNNRVGRSFKFGSQYNPSANTQRLKQLQTQSNEYRRTTLDPIVKTLRSPNYKSVLDGRSEQKIEEGYRSGYIDKKTRDNLVNQFSNKLMQARKEPIVDSSGVKRPGASLVTGRTIGTSPSTVAFERSQRKAAMTGALEDEAQKQSRLPASLTETVYGLKAPLGVLAGITAQGIDTMTGSTAVEAAGGKTLIQQLEDSTNKKRAAGEEIDPFVESFLGAAAGTKQTLASPLVIGGQSGSFLKGKAASLGKPEKQAQAIEQEQQRIYDELGVNSWYESMTGDPTNLDRQIARVTAQNIVQNVPLAMTNIAGMQIVGNAFARALMPAIKTNLQLNLARGAGMMLPSAVTAAGVATNNETLQTIGNPVESLQRTQLPASEQQIRQEVGQMEGMEGQQMAMTLGTFGLGAPSLYKDAAQLFKISRTLGKAGVFGKIAKINPASIEGRNLLNDYTRLQSEVIPDVAFGLTNIFDPVARTIGSKFNENVKAPTAEEWMKTAILTAVAVRPHKSMQGLFASNLNRGTDIAGQAKFAAMDAVDNSSFHALGVNARYEALRGGSSANTQDLQRVTSHIYEMAAQEFQQQDRSASTYKSLDQIFFEILNGKSDNSINADQAIRQMRTRGDSSQLPFDSPLRQMEPNKNLFPIDPKFRKQAINNLAKQLQPTIAAQYDMIQRGAKIGGEEPSIEPADERKYYGIKIGEANGEPEYIVYNKRFSDATLHRGEAGLEDVRIIGAINQDSVSANARIERLTNIMRSLKSEFGPRENMWIKNGVAKAIGVIRPDGTIVIKESKSTGTDGNRQAADVTYSYASLDEVQKELSGIPGKQRLITALNEVYNRGGLRRDVASKQPVVDIGSSENFPSRIQFTTDQQINGRLVDTIGLQTPIGVYQLPDGGVALGGIAEGSRTRLRPLSETDVASTPELQTRTVLSQVADFIKNGSGYVDADIHELGANSRVEIPADLQGVLKEIMDSEAPDAVKAQEVMSVIIDEVAGNRLTGDKAARLDKERGVYVNDVELKAGDRVIFASDETNPLDVTEGVVIKADNGLATVKDVSNPTGASYTLSADRFIMSDANINRDALVERLNDSLSRGDGKFDRPIEMTVSDEEAIARFLTATETIDRKQAIANASPEEIFNVVLDSIVNSRATVEGIQLGLIEWAARNSPEGVFDVMARVVNDITAPGKEVPVVKLRKATQIFSDRMFNQTLYGVHAVYASVASLSETRLSSTPSTRTISQKASMLQLARRMNILMMRAETMSDENLFTAAARSLNLDLTNLNKQKVIEFAQNLRGIAPHVFYYMQDLWHVSKLSGSNYAAQSTLGRAISAVGDASIRSLILGDELIPDSALDFWKSEQKFDQAIKDIRTLINSPRTVEIEGQSQRYSMKDVAYARLRNAGLEFLYHMAMDTTRTLVRRGLIQNRQEAVNWQNDSMSFMYDTYLPQVVVDQINGKISSGDFMRDGDGRIEQTNNISYAPELRAFHTQIIDSIKNNFNLSDEQKQQAIQKIDSVVAEVDLLLPSDVDALSTYDDDGPRQARLRQNLTVNGEVIAEDQPANLKAISAERHYDKSLSTLVKESGMTLTEAAQRKHVHLFDTFKEQAGKLFGLDRTFTNISSRIQNTREYMDVKRQIDRLQVQGDDDPALRRELYSRLNQIMNDKFDDEFRLATTTLKLLRSIQPESVTGDDITARVQIFGDTSRIQIETTTLGDAVDTLLNRISELKARLMSTSDVTEVRSGGAFEITGERTDESVIDEADVREDEDVYMLRQSIRAIDQQIAEQRRAGQPIEELQARRNAEQVRFNDAVRIANNRNVDPLSTYYDNLNTASAAVKLEIGKLSVGDISIEEMLKLHQLYMSLARTNPLVTGEVNQRLVSSASVDNIVATNEIRRLRGGVAEAEVFATASITDVVELQAGTLSPDSFAEKYNINLSVAQTIAEIDALNPSNRSEPINLTDEDMIGISMDNIDPELRAFVGDAPQIATELVRSPDSFGGMITFKDAADQGILAYTAQNLAGMKILMRTIVGRNFRYGDVESANMALSDGASRVIGFVADSYVDPSFMSEKLRSVNNIFNDLNIDGDVADYVDGFLKSTTRQYELQLKDLPRNSPRRQFLEQVIFDLKNPPALSAFVGKRVSDYYKAIGDNLSTTLEYMPASESKPLVDALLKTLSPDTNSNLKQRTISQNFGARMSLTDERDAAFTARRIIATLGAKGITLRGPTDKTTAIGRASDDPVINHSSVRLTYLPMRMSEVPMDVASNLVTLYDEILNTQLPPIDTVTNAVEKTFIQQVIDTRDAYNEYAMGDSDASVASNQVRSQLEREAIIQLADNLANVYDIHANSYAQKHFDVQLRTNSGEFKREVAEALNVLNIDPNSARRLMEPTMAVVRFLADLDPTQKAYVSAYLVAKYKKQYYTSHNKIFLVNDDLLAEADAEAKLFVDKRDVYGFTQTLKTNQQDAIGSLLYIGSNGNNKYRTTLTLVHEVFHPLFTGMDDGTQVDFMDQLAPKSSLAIDALNEVLLAAKQGAGTSSIREVTPENVAAIQKVLDSRGNVELALALQVKVAKEGMANGLQLKDSLASLKGITFNGEDLSNGWISHAHEKFVTSMMNFISDYTIPISRNAAASVDMTTLEVFQQMRSTLRHVMRKISNKRPLDIIKDVDGTPHAAWYSRVPVQRYSFSRVHNPNQFNLNALMPNSQFTRHIDFAQLRKNDYLRINIPNRPESRSAIESPTQLLMGLDDSLTLNTYGDYGGSRFRFGFKHDGQIGDDIAATWLPFENPELRKFLASDPDMLRAVTVFPENGRNDTNVISADAFPSRSFAGQVQDMIIKTRFNSFEDAKSAGFDPVYSDKNNVWVRGEVDEDGWFKPRVRVQSDNPRVLDYAVAGQHEYAYIVDAPTVVRVGEGRGQKNFPSRFRFIVGQDALDPQTRAEYDPILVGYTQEFDPKFSALVYDLTRKLGRVVYNTTGNVRWAKQLELQSRLLTGDAKSFTIRTETPVGEALDAYFKSSEYKAIRASRSSMQPLIIDGANQFEASLAQIVGREYSTLFDGEPIITESGERFVNNVNDEINNILAPYIAEQMLFRHDAAETYQTNSFTIEPNSQEMNAMFSAFQVMMGEDMDINLLKQKLNDAYVALNSRGDVRVSPNTRIDRALSLNGVPETSMLPDGTEYHVRDLMIQMLRNDRLVMANTDLLSLQTSFENLWNNVLTPFINTGTLDAPYELNSAKPTTAMYVLDTLLNSSYGNSVENKRLFLERLTADVNRENYGDTVNDVNARIRYQEAVQAKNSAVGQFLSVAHTLDAQSREIGRALYAWKDWSLLDNQESFTGATGNTASVIIRSPEGATFRVNLNNPRNFVESVARDVNSGAYIDASPFSQMFNLYNPERTTALRATTNSPTPYSLRDLNLTPYESAALIQSGSLDVVRPYGIDNNMYDIDGNAVTPQLRIYRLTRTGKGMDNRPTITDDRFQKIDVNELQHSYKSGYITGENNDVWVNNQRLLQQPINDLLRRSFLSDPSMTEDSRNLVTNTVIVPREVHIAKLLVSRALIDNTDQVPDRWKRKNAIDNLTRQRLLEGDKEATIADTMKNPRVEHNRTRTWMSEGVEDGVGETQEMSDQELSYFRMPFDLTPEQAQDKALRDQYETTMKSRAIEKALAVPQPKNIVIKRETDPRQNKVAVTAKDSNLYISIPDSEYDYVTRTMFSASGPTSTPAINPAIAGLAPGGTMMTKFSNSPFTKRGGNYLLGAYHELTSMLKALVLSGDFARPMLQNFRLTAMNPKNTAMQFYGMAAFLPNMWMPGSRTTGTPVTGLGKFLNFTMGHRPDLAWGDQQYHAQMFNMLNKYGTKGNQIGFGIPGVHKRTVKSTYNWANLAEYGLKTSYGDWYQTYEAAKLIDPTIDPFEMPIQTSQAENIGEGVLARRIPFVNMWERAGALSTDILRVKSFLEFAAYIDQHVDYDHEYQKESAKRDYAAFLNVATGHPTGNNAIMSDTQNAFNQNFRTIYTSPNWYNSLSMQTYLPSLAKMYLAEGVNRVSRKATRGFDTFGVGYDLLDSSTDQKWWRTLRNKQVLMQHVFTGAGAISGSLMIGSLLQLMGLYAERRQLHEVINGEYIDFADWRKVMSPVLNEEGVDIASKLKIEQADWWNPFSSDYGIVRAANTLQWNLPPIFTFYKRLFFSPLIAAVNEPALATHEKAAKFATEMYKSNIEARLGQPAQAMKMAITGRTYTEESAFQKHPGLRMFTELDNRVKRYQELYNEAKSRGDTSMARKYEVELKKLRPALRSPQYAHLLGLAKAFPNGISRFAVSTLENLQVQNALKDMEELGYSEFMVPIEDDQNADIQQLAFPAFSRIIGLEGRSGDFYLQDLITKEERAGMSGKQFEFLTKKFKYKYPNASNMISRFGFGSLFTGVPGSGGYDGNEPYGIDKMRGVPDPAVLRLSGENPNYLPEILKRQAPPTLEVPSDYFAGRKAK